VLTGLPALAAPEAQVPSTAGIQIESNEGIVPGGRKQRVRQPDIQIDVDFMLAAPAQELRALGTEQLDSGLISESGKRFLE
jgi:hypothetical protein